MRVKVLGVTSVATAVVGLLVLLGGCGGGTSDSSTADAAPLTKAQFIKQANLICEKGLEEKDGVLKTEFEKLSPKERANPSKQTVEGLVEALLPPLKQITKELAELPPPARDEKVVNGIVAKLEAGMEKAEANPAELPKNNPFESADAAARAYGLERCTY